MRIAAGCCCACAGGRGAGRWGKPGPGYPLAPRWGGNGITTRGVTRGRALTMSHKSRADSSFTCIVCGGHVPARGFGTNHRNHCPCCLWSRHLDEEPGDRGAACREPMEPIAIEVRKDGEWAIVHRCTGCGLIRTNRIGGDAHERALLALALRPIASPAFPLDDIRRS
jgi:hypothetical protein